MWPFFYPPKSTTSIACVSPVVVSPASRMIAVRNAMTGRMIAAIASASMWRSCLCSVRGRRRGRLSLLLFPFLVSPHRCRSPLASCLRLRVPGDYYVSVGVGCCAVTYSVAGLVRIRCPVCSCESGRKRHRVEDPMERKRMLAKFEDFWASGKSFSPRPGPLSAPLSQLITPPVVVPAPFPSVAPDAVVAGSAATLSDSSRSASSSARSYEQSRSQLLSEPRSAVHSGPGLWGFAVPFLVPVPSPVQDPSASRSRSRAPSAIRSRSQAPASTQSRLRVQSPARSASSARSWSLHLSSEWSQASSNRSSSVRTDSRSRLRAKSPAHMQPSSSSVVVASGELRSLLDAVPVLY